MHTELSVHPTAVLTLLQELKQKHSIVIDGRIDYKLWNVFFYCQWYWLLMLKMINICCLWCSPPDFGSPCFFNYCTLQYLFRLLQRSSILFHLNRRLFWWYYLLLLLTFPQHMPYRLPLPIYYMVINWHLLCVLKILFFVEILWSKLPKHSSKAFVKNTKLYTDMFPHNSQYITYIQTQHTHKHTHTYVHKHMRVGVVLLHGFWHRVVGTIPASDRPKLKVITDRKRKYIENIIL